MYFILENYYQNWIKCVSIEFEIMARKMLVGREKKRAATQQTVSEVRNSERNKSTWWKRINSQTWNTEQLARWRDGEGRERDSRAHETNRHVKWNFITIRFYISEKNWKWRKINMWQDTHRRQTAERRKEKSIGYCVTVVSVERDIYEKKNDSSWLWLVVSSSFITYNRTW